MSRISDRFEQFVEAGMPPSITSRRAPAARKLEGARVQRREAAAIEFTKACYLMQPSKGELPTLTSPFATATSAIMRSDAAAFAPGHRLAPVALLDQHVEHLLGSRSGGQATRAAVPLGPCASRAPSRR